MSIYKGNSLIAGGRQCMPLLSFMWADHVLNDASWLRADTFSWQSGAVYQAAYQHLAADITGKTLQSETISGTTIQFYLADDGHKICPASQESNVTAIYNATGVAWYYIIDTTNQRFKLPRAKHGKFGDMPVIGNGMTLGLTDGTNNFGLGMRGDGDANYWALRVGTGAYGTSVGSGFSQGYSYGTKGVTTDPTKSGLIAQQEQDIDQYKYLYFYVGNFTQTALENTAGLNTELFNGKADVSTVAHVVTEFQEPTAANNYTWYRKYADGWVEQGGYMPGQNSGWGSATITLPVPMASRYYYISRDGNWSDASSSSCTITTMTATAFSLTYASNTMDVYGTMWQVSGMAA